MKYPASRALPHKSGFMVGIYIRKFRMPGKPMYRIGASWVCLLSGFPQLLCNCQKELTGNPLTSQRIIDKSVLDLDQVLRNGWKRHFRNSFSGFVVDIDSAFRIIQLHFPFPFSDLWNICTAKSGRGRSRVGFPLDRRIWNGSPRGGIPCAEGPILAYYFEFRGLPQTVCRTPCRRRAPLRPGSTRLGGLRSLPRSRRRRGPWSTA